jgi:hypothetical protein
MNRQRFQRRRISWRKEWEEQEKDEGRRTTEQESREKDNIT